MNLVISTILYLGMYIFDLFLVIGALSYAQLLLKLSVLSARNATTITISSCCFAAQINTRCLSACTLLGRVRYDSTKIPSTSCVFYETTAPEFVLG